MRFTDNLYKISDTSDNFFEIILADKEHEVFRAHFPDTPILPGFLQIDIAIELFDLDMKKIKKTKFLNIIKPEDVIIFKSNKNKILLESKDNKKISEISYE